MDQRKEKLAHRSRRKLHSVPITHILGWILQYYPSLSKRATKDYEANATSWHLNYQPPSISKRSVGLALNKAASRVHVYLRCDDLPRPTCSLGYDSETMTKYHENAMSYEHSQHKNTWTGKETRRRGQYVYIQGTMAGPSWCKRTAVESPSSSAEALKANDRQIQSGTMGMESAMSTVSHGFECYDGES